ncbi:hypothetical protein ACFU98_29395 [Streptomyces sp. NPDC057575]|uniref:hypothetical protein n=1 Tax=unclassified Streptomyces TaxID=2593676 RepID=UPI0036987B75
MPTDLAIHIWSTAPHFGRRPVLGPRSLAGRSPNDGQPLRATERASTPRTAASMNASMPLSSCTALLALLDQVEICQPRRDGVTQ